MTLTDGEVIRLRSFRRAASQVRDASIIAQGRRIEVHGIPHAAGHVDIYVRLLQQEPFRSLALAIRLVYQEREPAQFRAVCNLLFRDGSEDVRQRVAEIRAQYDEALQDPAYGLHVTDGVQPDLFGPEEVFQHWLYGIVFHQDPKRQSTVQRLEAEGAHFVWAVQGLSLQLAGRILDLDDVIAYYLNEDPLPRIQPDGRG